MDFRFAITEEYLKDYEGKKAFWGAVEYSIYDGLVEIKSISLAPDCFIHLTDNAELLGDMYEAAKIHAAPYLAGLMEEANETKNTPV